MLFSGAPSPQVRSGQQFGGHIGRLIRFAEVVDDDNGAMLQAVRKNGGTVAGVAWWLLSDQLPTEGRRRHAPQSREDARFHLLVVVAASAA